MSPQTTRHHNSENRVCTVTNPTTTSNSSSNAVAASKERSNSFRSWRWGYYTGLWPLLLRKQQQRRRRTHTLWRRRSISSMSSSNVVHSFLLDLVIIERVCSKRAPHGAARQNPLPPTFCYYHSCDGLGVLRDDEDGHLPGSVGFQPPSDKKISTESFT